jgi:hypothetical protein
LLDELPLPASRSESAPARVADSNEWNFANHNSPHSAIFATERHAELESVYEGLMTDSPTGRQLHIERGVAAERHRRLEGGGQTGDARAAIAAVKLEREKLQKELGRLDFMVYGRSGRSQVQQPNPNRSDLHAIRSISHWIPRSARKSGNRASGVEFAVFLTAVNLRPRDFVFRSLDAPALRICISRSSIEACPARVMPRSHMPFLKCVLNPSVRVVVVPKVSLVTEIKDIRSSEAALLADTWTMRSVWAFP